MRTFRTQLGLSAPRLASLTADGERPISENMIREIEAGRRREVGVATVLRLSAAMGIPPVCLMVNHRDPFGPCDVPGMEGTGLRNHEVSVMFDASTPVSGIRAEWAASEELRFSVMTNHYLHDLGALRERNRLARGQYHDFLMGEGHYADVADILLRKADAGEPDASPLSPEEMFHAFFLERGGWIRWRIGRVLRKLGALEKLHGCRDDKSFRRMLETCADETEWVKRGRSQQTDHDDDEPFPPATPPSRFDPFESYQYKEATPYDLMWNILKFLGDRRRARPQKKDRTDPYEYAYDANEGGDVRLYVAMALALSQLAVEGAMLEPTDIYRRMDERFDDIIKKRGLPPFELLLDR